MVQLAEGRELTRPRLLESGAFSEAARLAQKIANRHDMLLHEASDARFNLRAILAGLEDGVLVADHRSLITLVNPALIQLFALRSDPVGQSVLTTFRLPILKSMVDGALEDGAPQQAEIELPGVIGESSGQVIVSAVPLNDAGGRAGAVMVFRNVSRLRRLEEVRREFVANVSHELRTPLSIFQGYLENLLETPDLPAEDVQAGLLVMRKHALRLNALVEDLLALARLESKRDELRPEAINLDEVLKETVTDWAGKAAAKHLRMLVDVPPDLTAQLDLLKFQQVLDNLLDNAVKYSADGGEVRLRASSSNGHFELRVEDSGTGIPRQDLPHIFERFYRADKARSREMGGTGLGLAIVKHIVQAHGGTVRAESEYQNGTSIILTLPLETAPSS